MKHIECRTQWHVPTAYLWSRRGEWLPIFETQSRQTDFGFIGSSGEQRVREPARNDARIPEELRNKVEKKREGKYEQESTEPHGLRRTRCGDVLPFRRGIISGASVRRVK
jgi:hypothetical protein